MGVQSNVKDSSHVANLVSFQFGTVNSGGHNILILIIESIAITWGDIINCD